MPKCLHNGILLAILLSYLTLSCGGGGGTSPTFTLTLTKNGNGTVISSPAGINCGTDCSEPYPSGTTVTLTATPDPGWQFDSWQGCDSVNSDQCTLTIDAAKNVTANFVRIGYSLRFYGNAVSDIDRVKIQIDPHVPADVGATDFTLEFWMKANPGENASNAVSCNTNDGWITGNIVFDRDIWGPGDHGDFGISLNGCRMAFGVSYGGSGNTICGNLVVTDGVWHHIAVTRRFGDGELCIYVDGQQDVCGPGNVGANQNVSYRDARSTEYPDSDPFLVIGAEKHDAGPDYPSYRGWIDEVRLSNVIRYTGHFTPPSGPFIPDDFTVALYHFDEGAGETVFDSSGAAGGPSNGIVKYGGAPQGPEWSTETPF